MPWRQLDSIDYFLALFDKDGNERVETDGSTASTALTKYLDDHRDVTDVYLISHGWKGDISTCGGSLGGRAAQPTASAPNRSIRPSTL
jgi:hypothetical protein